MISVCIATYNGAEFIYQQISSILYQLNAEDEIIISDDGSTDNTLEIIESFNDGRIKLYNHQKKEIKGSNVEKNISYVSNNIQNALSKAKGDIIFLADQDDIWLEGRIDKVKKYFTDKQKPTVVVCDCTIVDANNNIIKKSYFETINPSSSILNIIIKNPYLGCCMCFNKALVAKIFPFPYYSLGHDLWIGLIGKLTGNVHFIDDQLVLYRRHGLTVTKSGGTSTNSLWFKIKYRIKLTMIIFRKALTINKH
ncbi:TPA: glycosyltransferase family 2 protein [Escherichia coli]|nr:glycosyltransferase family 2 protein [Escherichia coli]